MQDTMTVPEYSLGDQQNGYVLTETGWVPLPPDGRPKRGRKALAIGAVTALGLTTVAGLGFGGYMFYENGQRAEALAEAQAEYDAFVVESEGVWDLLSELDIQTENGLNYSEHDDLTDDLASELARMDVEGPMAEAVADDLEDLVGLYGEANLAWNEKIYGSSFDEDAKEAELQAAWAEADALWDDIQRTVDDWDTTLKNGELPEAAGTV